MAGKSKNMSQIKQLLLLKKNGVSNRKAASIIGINKETVNNYMSKVNADELGIDDLQKYPYTREERFLAIDKPNLMPLLECDFEIVSYADLKIASNCCIYLGRYQHYYTVRIASTLHRFFLRLAQTGLLKLDDFGMKVPDGQPLLDFMKNNRR